MMVISNLIVILKTLHLRGHIEDYIPRYRDTLISLI
jgi:hypothetical protein